MEGLSDVGRVGEQLLQKGNPADKPEGHARPVGQRGCLPVKIQELLLLFTLFPEAAGVCRGGLVLEGCSWSQALSGAVSSDSINRCTAANGPVRQPGLANGGRDVAGHGDRCARSRRLW